MENTWKEPSRTSRVYPGRLRAFLMLWRGGGLPLPMAATSRGLYQMLGGRSVVKPALGGTQGGRRRRRGQRKGGRAQWQMRQRDPWARRHVGEGALTGGTDEMGMEGGAFATLRAGRMNLAVLSLCLERGGGETLEEDFALGTCHRC